MCLPGSAQTTGEQDFDVQNVDLPSVSVHNKPKMNYYFTIRVSLSRIAFHNKHQENTHG